MAEGGRSRSDKMVLGTPLNNLVRPDWTRGLIPLSYDVPIRTEYWDDDGTPEYREMFERLEREGMVLL